MTKPVTYRNTGATDVTLDLAVDTGMFSLSANQFTVPAGGTATVNVTADPKAGAADGVLSGVVVATASDAVTRTPVGLVREEESYNLTLNYLDDTHGNAIVMPGVALDHDLSFDVDARDTRPIEVPPPKPATFAGGRTTYLVRAENGKYMTGSASTYTELGNLTTARLGDALPAPRRTTG